ncbi:MAG: carboxypeptidase-like regulatory domain-containing protein, partial [Cyclobacteriaceae bacterium]|nr:carboxypeptidase-like regulatory domain-containing protein [Cyclobacteriaceae bacterium]
MKRLLILPIFLIVLSWNFVAFSQSSPLDKKINLNVNSEKLGKVLKLIEKEGKFKFSYSRKIVPVQEKVTYQSANKSISEILTEILSPLGIEFVQVEKQVVLRRAKEVKTADPPKPIATREKSNYTISGNIRDMKSGESLIGATIYINELKSGSITNAYGFYSITIPAGNYHFTYSFIGYK